MHTNYAHLREGLLDGENTTAFSDKYNLLWLDPLGFSNHYVLATRPDTQLKKISDLQKNPDIKIAIDPEFASRLEYTLLQKSYPMQWQSKLMDQVLLYFSLKNKAIDVISTYSTDGRIQGKEFVILQDDKGCLPNYEVAPLVLKSSLSKHPELYSVFALLKEAISEEEISHLNYQFEFLRKDVRDFTDAVKKYQRNLMALLKKMGYFPAKENREELSF